MLSAVSFRIVKLFKHARFEFLEKVKEAGGSRKKQKKVDGSWESQKIAEGNGKEGVGKYMEKAAQELYCSAFQTQNLTKVDNNS